MNKYLKAAELNIKINEGNIVIRADDTLEFTDIQSFTIEELSEIIDAAIKFIDWRNGQI